MIEFRPLNNAIEVWIDHDTYPYNRGYAGVIQDGAFSCNVPLTTDQLELIIERMRSNG
jgi:hypothetical protein